MINERQRGFIENKSTSDNIKEVVDFMKEMKWSKDKGGLLFIDFKNAFNKVNRSILIQKMKNMQINETTLNIIISLL